MDKICSVAWRLLAWAMFSMLDKLYVRIYRAVLLSLLSHGFYARCDEVWLSRDITKDGAARLDNKCQLVTFGDVAALL